MKAKILKLVALGVILSSAPPATAQNARPQEGVRMLMNAWSTPEKCNSENAIKVRLRHAIAHQSQFLGKCIKTKGYYSRRALYTEIGDIGSTDPSSRRSIAAHRIGVLGKQEYLDELYEDDPQEKIEIIGEFTTCERLAASLGGFFMGSYCHYTGGPIILMSSYSR